MWLFTRHGLFSVVRNVNDYHIRARRRDHLVNLVELAFGPDQEHRIISTPRGDYKYRIIVPLITWKSIASVLAKDVDYSNFKDNAPERVLPGGLLHAVWSLRVKFLSKERKK
jgi:hypothetical protein